MKFVLDGTVLDDISSYLLIKQLHYGNEIHIVTTKPYHFTSEIDPLSEYHSTIINYTSFY